MHTTTKSPFKILFNNLSRSSSRYVLKCLNCFCCFSSCTPILKGLTVHLTFHTYLHHIGYMDKNHIPVLSWSISTAFATALNLNFTFFLESAFQHTLCFSHLFLTNNFCITLNYRFSTGQPTSSSTPDHCLTDLLIIYHSADCAVSFKFAQQ